MKKKQLLSALKILEKRAREKNNAMALESISSLSQFVEDDFADKEIALENTQKSHYPLPAEVGELDAYSVYSDGGCRGNPGPGAWGILGQDPKGNVLFEGSEYHPDTTNNQMELLGATRALENIVRHLALNKKPQSTPVYLFSDSKYVIDGLLKWVPGWKERGWKKADKKDPENLELWKNFDFVAAKFKNLKLIWVKGHSGHPQNERCDQLCNLELDKNS